MTKTYFTYNEILYGKVCHDFGLAWLRVPQPPAKISPNKLLYAIDCVGLRLRITQPPAKISPNKLLYAIDCVGPGIGRQSHQAYATDISLLWS